MWHLRILIEFCLYEILRIKSERLIGLFIVKVKNQIRDCVNERAKEHLRSESERV